MLSQVLNALNDIPYFFLIYSILLHTVLVWLSLIDSRGTKLDDVFLRQSLRRIGQSQAVGSNTKHPDPLTVTGLLGSQKPGKSGVDKVLLSLQNGRLCQGINGLLELCIH